MKRMRRYFKRTYKSGPIYLCYSGIENEKEFLAGLKRDNERGSSFNEPCADRCVKRLFGYLPDIAVPWPQ
jgi:hypothetical protein